MNALCFAEGVFLHAQPAHVLFTPDGSKIIVSELTSNHLSIFHVNKNGTVSGPVINDSSGVGTFGAYFLSTGLLLVTESFSSALSSYTMSDDGALHMNDDGTLVRMQVAAWSNFPYFGSQGLAVL